MASPLGRLFGKSPIAPIQQHMQLAQENVQLLCEFFAALTDEDRQRASDILALLTKSLKQGRELRHGIREHLPRGLLLAMPRADLLDLVDIQQDILQRSQNIATPLAARGLALPDTLHQPIDRLCNVLADAADKALAAIRELDEILEMAFVQRERGPVHEALDKLKQQLSECEEHQHHLLTELVQQEASLAPVDAVLLYGTIGDLADLARRCSEVGDQLELLLAR
jgi:predicted phosphate transport protein (TIGR00153 family)